MDSDELVVVNLDELASRWQIPVERVMYFITDCAMPMDDEGQGKWFSDNWELVIAEKQKAFDASLFPEKFRQDQLEQLPL
jgi:hypothetical protein